MTFYQQEIIRIERDHFPCSAVLKRCRMAKRMIDERCCEGVDLDAIAQGVFVSKFHFIRQFSRCYGKTPYRYLTERRIQVAKELLDDGMEVKAVCARIGFSSVPSFTLLFRRMTGKAPATYRQMRNIR